MVEQPATDQSFQSGENGSRKDERQEIPGSFVMEEPEINGDIAQEPAQPHIIAVDQYERDH